MQTPPYLTQGDIVLIIATARKISKEELQFAITFFENNGLHVELGPNIFEVKNQYAGTDEQRTSDLQWALNHTKAKAIIIARGGYGTVKLIDNIDFTAFKQNPKWVVGYSDVTVLHSAINKIGIESLHATMPINFKKNKEATQSLLNALLGNYKMIDADYHHSNKTGTTTAEIVGGNLSLLYALAATPYDSDTTDKILFIEDLDEYLYHIDRMMMQFKLSGKLKNLKGIIVGGMSDMKDNAIPFGKLPDEIILDAVKDYNYPVCFDFPAGHIDENMALYLGKNAQLTVSEQGTTLNFI